MSNRNSTDYDKMTHAKIPLENLPQGLHAKHPFKDEKTHESLLNYLQQRLSVGCSNRDSKLARMVRIDKTVAGWIRLPKEDRDRIRKEEEQGIPQAIMQHLPLTMVQLDDMMTYFSQVFAPSRGMFFVKGKPDEQKVGDGIVTLMNNHATYSGYYREAIMTILNTLKYNLGGFHAAWDEDKGPKLQISESDGLVNTEEDVVWRGNRLKSMDMYNTLLDPSVHPTELHRLGEFGAHVDIISHFQLQRMASQGKYWNTEKVLQDAESHSAETNYYKHPPTEAMMDADDSVGIGSNENSRGQTNWVAVMRAQPGTFNNHGYERVMMYCWLNPYEQNLVPKSALNAKGRNHYELWRFTIINDKYIIEATHVDSAHGHIPLYFGVLNDDLMGPSSKSYGEILKPLQDFASFLMNTHIHATRKNIWGLTVYDPSVVDLSEIPEGTTAARVPLKPSGWGQDVNKAVWEHRGTVDTKQTMGDLDSMMGIMNQFFPASSAPSQVAGIDRAVNSQVAAVVQGSNRRMQKGAMLLDHSMFRPMRHAMYFNIIQNESKEITTTDFHGREVKIDLAKLKETDLPYIIGQGIKAIDLQASAEKMQMIIFALIQNPPVAGQLDLLGMIDYWVSMMDVDVDMTKFRLAQTPEESAAGMQGEDPANVRPDAIAEPANVTGALVGG